MDRYYTYLHRHPKTQEVFYVGLGQNDRAWAFTSKARSPEHKDFLLDLIKDVYLPSDWVVITGRNLTQHQAFEQERQLIQEYQPRFNKDKGQRQMSAAEKKEALDMYLSGISFKGIAEKMGYHYSTVRMHIRKFV